MVGCGARLGREPGREPHSHFRGFVESSTVGLGPAGARTRVDRPAHTRRRPIAHVRVGVGSPGTSPGNLLGPGSARDVNQAPRREPARAVRAEFPRAGGCCTKPVDRLRIRAGKVVRVIIAPCPRVAAASSSSKRIARPRRSPFAAAATSPRLADGDASRRNNWGRSSTSIDRGSHSSSAGSGREHRSRRGTGSARPWTCRSASDSGETQHPDRQMRAISPSRSSSFGSPAGSVAPVSSSWRRGRPTRSGAATWLPATTGSA